MLTGTQIAERSAAKQKGPRSESRGPLSFALPWILSCVQLSLITAPEQENTKPFRRRARIWLKLVAA
jgi:hypothetical protein